MHINNSWALGLSGFVLGIVFTVGVTLSVGSASAQPGGKYVVDCGGSGGSTIQEAARNLTAWYNENAAKGLKFVGPISGVSAHCALFSR